MEERVRSKHHTPLDVPEAARWRTLPIQENTPWNISVCCEHKVRKLHTGANWNAYQRLRRSRVPPGGC